MEYPPSSATVAHSAHDSDDDDHLYPPQRPPRGYPHGAWDTGPKKSYMSDTDFASSELVLTPPPPPPPPETKTLWKAVIPDSVPCRLYILVIILQTLVDLIIEAVLVIKWHQAARADPRLDQSSERRLPIYFTIFGLAHVFQFVLALDAVWMRNTLQFFFLTGFNLILLTYALFQIFEFREVLKSTSADPQSALFDIPINVLTAIIPVVTTVAECAYVVLGWSIWREFGWKVYKLLGADRRIRTMYMHYQILACIMKFDVFFWAGFSIQLIWMVLQDTNVEYYVTVAALPASLIVLAAGHLSARYEYRPVMYAFMASCVGACGYFGFKLFRIIQGRNTESINPVLKTLVGFAVLAILFLVATFTWACIVLRNFDKGLKYHMSKGKGRSTQGLKRGATQRFDVGANLNGLESRSEVNFKRMSLE